MRNNQSFNMGNYINNQNNNYIYADFLHYSERSMHGEAFDVYA